MNFEEFKKQALNPEYPENECIYRVDVLSVEDPLKDIFEESYFKVVVSQRFLYLDKEAAEMKVKQIGTANSHNTSVFAIYLYELPIGKDVVNNQFQRVWSYNRFGCLISQSYATEVIDDIDHPSAKYKGRGKESIECKPGEIVEVYDRKNGCIVRGIVANSPLTIEECWKKFKLEEKKCIAEGLPAESANENYRVYALDDSYLVLLTQYFHSSLTPRNWDVFPVAFPLPHRLREELYQEYEEYSSEQNEEKDMENCSFQELLDML